MARRLVWLTQAKVFSVSSAAVFQIGDNGGIHTRFRALALQREIPVYLGDEGSFEAYPIFARPHPEVQFPPEAEKTTRNLGTIQVGPVKVLGVSASSVMQVGGSGPVSLQSRIKHIRQFRPIGPYTNPTGTIAYTGSGENLEAESGPPEPGSSPSNPYGLNR
ncbi:spore germination protein GerPE [Paenibacillus chitinolyticus]|uniref:spore germination protein GerPE n=1 Tax=Paenibacillus chitinolyticus TaxID=79263 RepID=UPI00366D0F75